MAKKINSNYTWARIYIASPKSSLYDEVIENKYFRPEYRWNELVAVDTPNLPLEKITKLHKKMGREFNKMIFKQAFINVVQKRSSPSENVKNLLNWAKWNYNFAHGTAKKS